MPVVRLGKPGMMKSSFRIGIDSILLLEYSDSTEYTVFKKESPSPVEVEPGDLFLLKYGKRKKKQSITGKEIEKVRDRFPCSSRYLMSK